jgi:hypothetical protein
LYHHQKMDHPDYVRDLERENARLRKLALRLNDGVHKIHRALGRVQEFVIALTQYEEEEEEEEEEEGKEEPEAEMEQAQLQEEPQQQQQQQLSAVAAAAPSMPALDDPDETQAPVTPPLLPRLQVPPEPVRKPRRRFSYKDYERECKEKADAQRKQEMEEEEEEDEQEADAIETEALRRTKTAEATAWVERARAKAVKREPGL